MRRDLSELEILAQPNDFVCGPICLHAVYRFFGDQLPPEQVIADTPMLEAGGTLGVFLGLHALRRGYRATIYSYNLDVFDPTWSQLDAAALSERLERQIEAKQDPKLRITCRAYLEYLRVGGRVLVEDLTPDLIRRPLRKGLPVLTGLSATFLYREAREHPLTNAVDDVRGVPQGHFVVLCGYEPEARRVIVADPLVSNPIAPARRYSVPLDRVINSILLGVLTYDANLLVIEPGRGARARPR
jgi:hypothetical protein